MNRKYKKNVNCFTKKLVKSQQSHFANLCLASVVEIVPITLSQVFTGVTEHVVMIAINHVNLVLKISSLITWPIVCNLYFIKFDQQVPFSLSAAVASNRMDFN